MRKESSTVQKCKRQILLRVSSFLKPPLPQQMPFASKMNWPSALTGPISTRNI